MSDLEHIDDDDSALAAEYVLRLLDAEAAAEVEARLVAEPALRARVAFWEAEFAPMAEALAPVAPPAALRSRLMAEIAGESAARTAPRGPARERPRRPTRDPAQRPWSWFVLPPLTAAAAAFALVFFTTGQIGPPPEPAFRAEIASEDGSLRIAAGLVHDDNSLRVVRAAGAAPAGRVLELWVIAEGAEAPVSLGVLPEEAESRLTLAPEIAALIPGGVLAVSDEPPGGSPTGAPTGTVRAVGPFSET